PASCDGQLKDGTGSWSRARGRCAGGALDGGVLQIDDDANVAVYGRAATPRAIFESRTGAPSDAVVGFRDQLEEATAIARAARGDKPVPAPTTPAPGAPLRVQATVTEASSSTATETQTSGVEPVTEGKIRSEPLQTTP